MSAVSVSVCSSIGNWPPGDDLEQLRRGRSDDYRLHVGSHVPVDYTDVACGQAGKEFLEEVTNDFRRTRPVGHKHSWLRFSF
jgi:hypothetical protein